MKSAFIKDFYVNSQLDREIINDDINHAKLFLGPRGIGKFQTAKIFAHAVLCGKNNMGICSFSNLTHPDICVQKSNGVIKKSEIEDLISRAAKKPFAGSYKFLIIDDFEDVTTEGQNAILKTLEDASDYLKIILIASNLENILPTIVSRCRILKFSPISDERMEEFLRLRGAGENARLFAKLSEGSVARALDFFENPMYLNLRKECLDILIDCIRNGGYAQINALKFFVKMREHYDFLSQMMLMYMRDIELVRAGLYNFVINTDRMNDLKIDSKMVRDGNSIIGQILRTNKSIDLNINFELAIQKLLIQIGGHL